MPPQKSPINNLERLQAWQATEAAWRTFIPLVPIVTGLPAFDDALDGGLKRGQVYEVFGHESSGKTTLGLFLASRVQEQGGLCAWIDADHSLDAGYAAVCGVQPDRFWVSGAPNLEQGVAILERLAASGVIDWLVLDSLTALPLDAELRGRFSEDFLAQRDNFLRQALPHLLQTLRRSRATVLVISQTRHRRGHIYQSDQASTASLALKLHAAARFELTSTEVISNNDHIVGQEMQIRIVKHQTAPIFSTINIDIMYNQARIR